MARVPKGVGFGEGGDGVARLEAVLNDLIDDLTELRTKHNALLVQMDADAGITGTNFNATHAGAALKSIKSTAP